MKRREAEENAEEADYGGREASDGRNGYGDGGGDGQEIFLYLPVATAGIRTEA